MTSQLVLISISNNVRWLDMELWPESG